jgi:hypothetical protein
MAKEMLEALPLGRERLMSFELVLCVRSPPCANCFRRTHNKGRLTANARTANPST